MALVFRNVDASPDDPVETWPPEAVETALDRGDLSHSRRLAAAIRAEPWGDVARSVEAAIAMIAPYGSGPLFEELIEDARRTAVSASRACTARLIRQMVGSSGLSLRQCARRIGTSASRLSTYARGSVTPGADVLWRIAEVTGHQLKAEPRKH